LGDRKFKRRSWSDNGSYVHSDLPSLRLGDYQTPPNPARQGRRSVDLHLIDHNRSDSALTLPSGKISLKGSDAFQRWVIWTQPGKDFICLEPWTGPGNGLNTGEGLRTLAPGADERMSVEIRGD
jgi:galactose mutarotase-like enzyme